MCWPQGQWHERGCSQLPLQLLKHLWDGSEGPGQGGHPCQGSCLLLGCWALEEAENPGVPSRAATDCSASPEICETRRQDFLLSLPYKRFQSNASHEIAILHVICMQSTFADIILDGSKCRGIGLLPLSCIGVYWTLLLTYWLAYCSDTDFWKMCTLQQRAAPVKLGFYCRHSEKC